MSLRHALLAMFTGGPATGYDAVKRFNGSVGHVWHAPDSQIYPELKRMHRDGLVDAEQVRWGPRSTKTRYRITDDGIDELRDWVGTPHEHAPERDVHHMQAAYLEWTDADHARAVLTAHLDYHLEQKELLAGVRDGILARTDPMIVRRLAQQPEAEHDRIIAFKAFTYEGMIARSESEIAWAKRGLDMIDGLYG